MLASIVRRPCATLLALSLACLAPAPVGAAPPDTSEASRQAPSEAPEPAAKGPDEASIRSALADGDLTTARDLAVARSAAEPSAASFVLEAEVWQARGDYEQAKRAYTDALEWLGDDQSDERATIEGQLEQLEAESRGTRADEPPSTERERIDQERADRLAALMPKPEPPPIVDKPKPVPITKKWYFWVTLGAIVASAGAIVGIAASSAIDEKQNNAAARQPTMGGLTLRF